MEYPITMGTTLTIKKTADLLQTLVDLVEGNQQLPKDIQGCVTQVLDTQKKLVKKIDDFMHSDERRVDEIDIVTSIIDTCPEFLAARNDDTGGSLPIHWFALSISEEAVMRYVPLLAKAGRKYRIGGEEGRGGLLVESTTGMTAIECLTPSKSIDIMGALKNVDPPLILKEDVRNHQLIHIAVSARNFEMTKYMIEVDPSCLYYEHSEFGIPLEQLCIRSNNPEINEEEKKSCLQIAGYLVHEAVSYNVSHATIGGLFSKDYFGSQL